MHYKYAALLMLMICAVVGVHPLSSSTPVRRSSPRSAVPDDSNIEMGVCLSSSRPCRATRRTVKQAGADSRVVLTADNKNLISVAGPSSIDHVECRHRLRNSAGKRSQINGFVCDITEGSSLLSSRLRSSVGDEKLNASKPGVSELAVSQAAPQRRKRGWPKGVPRKKQVNYSSELISLLMVLIDTRYQNVVHVLSF